MPDLVLAPDAKSYSISEGRMGEILAQRNCASFVAVDESGAEHQARPGADHDRRSVLPRCGVLFLSGFRRRQAA